MFIVEHPNGYKLSYPTHHSAVLAAKQAAKAFGGEAYVYQRILTATQHTTLRVTELTNRAAQLGVRPTPCTSDVTLPDSI